mmetsp:Transcript_58126/g.189345  ORF Transcript_58126/g.189345 Transcript_58126/m.189345 type:complete len:89 (-) Transcript_58126:2876-3142(-)
MARFAAAASPAHCCWLAAILPVVVVAGLELCLAWLCNCSSKLRCYRRCDLPTLAAGTKRAGWWHRLALAQTRGGALGRELATESQIQV